MMDPQSPEGSGFFKNKKRFIVTSRSS